MKIYEKYLKEAPSKAFLQNVVKKLRDKKKKGSLTDKEQKILDKSEQELGEAVTPYTGTHVVHTTSIPHIKQVYGNTYKVDQMENAWYVYAKMGEQWIPVTTGFVEKGMWKKVLPRLMKSWSTPIRRGSTTIRPWSPTCR